MRMRVSGLLLIGALNSICSVSVAQTNSACSFRQDHDLGNGVILRQSLSADEKTVTIQMESQKQGYLAFAFSPSGGMLGNTAVIGLPGSPTNPVAFYDLSQYSVAGVQLLESYQDQLSDASISQNDAGTLLTFTMPVKDPKTGTVMVTAGTPTKIIYAIGGDNTLSYHTRRGSSSITFTACGQKPTDSQAVAALSRTTASVTATTADSGTSDSSSLGPGLTLTTQASADGLSAYFKLVYEGQAWLGIGPSPDGSMVGGQVVIGLPGQSISSTNPGKYSLSSKSMSGVNLMPNDQQTLKDATITQNDTHTVLSFIKLLSEPNEDAISLTSPTEFIFAVGTSNTLAFHQQYNSFSLTVGGAAVGFGADPRELWVAHGVLMALAWGLLVPLAILASVARDLLPLSPGMWFKIHRALNSLAVLCTIAGFSCAVAAFNKEFGKGHHFTGPQHTKIGLAIFILAPLQVGIALCRPHPPAAAKQPEEQRMGPDENFQDEINDDAADSGTEKKSTIRFLWECKHRMVGLVCLALAWYNCDSGIDLFATKYGDDKTDAFWAVTGSLGSLIVLGFLASKATGKH